MEVLRPGAQGDVHAQQQLVVCLEDVGALEAADQVRARRWARWLLLAFPPVALTTLFIVTGIRGRDFGFHWDEVDWQIRPVRDMVLTGLLIPRASIYPTLCKWLTFSTTAHRLKFQVHATVAVTYVP